MQHHSCHWGPRRPAPPRLLIGEACSNRQPTVSLQACLLPRCCPNPRWQEHPAQTDLYLLPQQPEKVDQGPRQKYYDSELEANALGYPREPPWDLTHAQASCEGGHQATHQPCLWTNGQTSGSRTLHWPNWPRSTGRFCTGFLPGFLLVTTCWHLVSLI